MNREEKLLIVEDNPLIAAAIEKAGERLNLRAEFASDGWDAIEKLRNGEYAAIVIDTDLPRHSGYGVVTFLRQENGEELENVVLMSASDPASVRERTSEHLRVIDRTDEVDEIAAALDPWKSR
ncbi:MAG TPA: response regulator [Thermoanaerobaculia bacterium]|nr:response regulator [Thermoanaerobaculia bacterium]